MRHPSHPALRVPQPLVDLFAWVADGETERKRRNMQSLANRKCGAVLGFAYFESSLFAPRKPEDAGELAYVNHPFELLPFAWNGSGGLEYAWAVLAPELDAEDYVCASWGPGDEGGARWLGDSTRQALEGLMVGAIRTWEKYEQRRGEPSPADDPSWAAICAACGLAPDPSSSEITAGARSGRPVVPAVPAGWRFEPTPDGLGVLAPAEAFGVEKIEIDRAWYEDEHIARAKAHLEAGRPAAALCLLKATRAESADYAPTVEAMRAVYDALGRPLLRERAERWLREHA